MRSQRGITLAEIMIVIFILAMLMAIAIPNFTIWIQNTQIRTGSEAILAGLQAARNEAIRRNTCVQVAFDPPPTTTGWRVNPCDSPDTDPPLQARSHGEGSVNAEAIFVPGGSTIVSFNALGRVVNPNPSDGTPPVNVINVGNPLMVQADARPLRIEVVTGGSIRLCDPSPSVPAGDPRVCLLP